MLLAQTTICNASLVPDWRRGDKCRPIHRRSAGSRRAAAGRAIRGEPVRRPLSHCLLAFSAVALAGQTNLLPAARARSAVVSVMHACPAAMRSATAAATVRSPIFPLPAPQQLAGADAVTILRLPPSTWLRSAVTSGSTRRAEGERKTWGSISARAARLNAALLGVDGSVASIVVDRAAAAHAMVWRRRCCCRCAVRAAIHAGQPFFPADVGCMALQRNCLAPRMLVTTPFHLRALLQDAIALPRCTPS